MPDEKLLERIVVNPKVMAGKPVIRGTRLTVQYILGLMAHGASTQEILDEYNGLSSDDLQACLLYASASLDQTKVLPLELESV